MKVTKGVDLKTDKCIDELIEFMNKKIETYGEDAFLNAYTNAICDWALDTKKPTENINDFSRAVLKVFREKKKLEK